MVSYVEIDKIQKAKYNPRVIGEKQLEELKSSFEKLGFIIPVLVNKDNGIIIAGHQRTKTAKAIGIDKIPVIYVDNVPIGDEIKFNQVHNSIDQSLYNSQSLIASYPVERFVTIKCKDVTSAKGRANSIKEICKLLMKYGNVLTCVICKNKVVFGNEYVSACKLLNIDINAYICEDSKYENCIKYLRQQYGKYNYDHLEKHTYVQGLAQMYRSTEKKEQKRANKSKLYETMVLPYLNSASVSSVLDFGCGKGAYIENLKQRYNAIGVEFYNNNRKGINVSKGNEQIDQLINYLKTDNKFDVVVCDSVLNSVDSVKAEKSVMAVINLFARQKAFISGRSLDFMLNRTKMDKVGTVTLNYYAYLDDNNFTANYREGNWYYQHFHDVNSITQLAKNAGFEIARLVYQGSSWQAELNKCKELSKQEYIDAIDFEFNLPLPNGKRYNRHRDIKRVLGYENQ